VSVKPGWYRDPADPSTQRYWDGEGWIGPSLPADAVPPPGPLPETTAQQPAEPPAPGPAIQVETPPTARAGTPPPAPTATPPAAQTETPPAAQTGTPPTAQTETPPAAQTGTPPPGWPPGYAFPAPRPHGLPLAPLGARLAARLIDIGILLLLNAVVNGWFVAQWVREVGPLLAEASRRILARDSSAEGLPQPDPQADSLLLVIVLIITALWLAYEVPALANGGQTIGKRLAGVKVLPLSNDQQLGFGRSLRRWNTLGLPVFLWYCCGLGLVLQLVDCGYALVDRPLRQALHDKRAQTVVVQVPRKPLALAGRRTNQRAKTPGGSA
jgi:uncharacterized RDD family membrane protein YckC